MPNDNEYVVYCDSEFDTLDLVSLLNQRIGRYVLNVIKTINCPIKYLGNGIVGIGLDRSDTHSPHSGTLIYLTDKDFQNSLIIDKDARYIVISFFRNPQWLNNLQVVARILLHAIHQYKEKGSGNYEAIDPLPIINEGTQQLRNDIACLVNAGSSDTHIVFLVPGIRTYGHWTDEWTLILKENGFAPVTQRFGWVDIIKFLMPSCFVTKASKNLLSAIVNENRKHNDLKISIIAHSLGTVIAAKALEMARDLGVQVRLDSLVLNGCILPKDYDWHNFRSEVVHIESILNVCGDGDIWPIMARTIGSPYGDAGSFYFNHNSDYLFNCRISKCDHSHMLLSSKTRDIWLGFLLYKTKPNNHQCQPSWLVEKINYYTTNAILYLLLLVLIIYIV